MENMKKTFEMPSAFESVKNQLLAEFPREHIENINTERVEDFIRQEGLEVKPFIVFGRKDIQKVKEIVGETGLLRSVFNNGESGLYSPEMDLILIVRDEDYEKSSGTIYTEGLLVHELAHASSMYQGYVTADQKSFYTPRVGFCLPQNKIPWGWVLEEGWADMHRADYFAQHASDEEKGKLEDALKFGNLDIEDTVPITTPYGETLPLPIKYLYVTPEGKSTTKSSAYAGYGLELLCKKDPSIKSLLVEARNSIEGLRKLTKEIEKVMPGLYKTLQASDYKEDSFSKNLANVISNVAGGTKNVITAKGTLKLRWNEILQKNENDVGSHL